MRTTSRLLTAINHVIARQRGKNPRALPLRGVCCTSIRMSILAADSNGVAVPHSAEYDSPDGGVVGQLSGGSQGEFEFPSPAPWISTRDSLLI